MPELHGNRRIQQAMATHVRSPACPPPSGVPGPIAALYRRLVRNVFADAIDRAFPVLRAMLGEASWTALSDGFIAEHRCDSPHLHAVPEAFVAWLAGRDTPAWTVELAHWEWLELDVGIAADDEVPVVAGLAFAAGTRVVAYGHPVHRLAPGVPVVPSLACLAMWRDAAYRVRFLQVDAPAFQVLSRIGDTPGLDRREVLHGTPDVTAADAFIERMLVCEVLVERR